MTDSKSETPKAASGTQATTSASTPSPKPAGSASTTSPKPAAAPKATPTGSAPAVAGTGSATQSKAIGSNVGPEAKGDTAGEGGQGAAEVQDTILKPGKAIGAQTEPAIFTNQGQIPHNTVPSPSGPVSAGLIADEDQREAVLEAVKAQATEGRKARRNSRQRLTEAKLESMSGAEVRAVAHDRGYDVGEGGRRAIRTRFLKCQEADEGLEDAPESGEGSLTVPLDASAGGGLINGPRPAVGASGEKASEQAKAQAESEK